MGRARYDIRGVSELLVHVAHHGQHWVDAPAIIAGSAVEQVVHPGVRDRRPVHVGRGGWVAVARVKSILTRIEPVSVGK